jgi:hypothetical protein
VVILANQDHKTRYIAIYELLCTYIVYGLT